ncbi:hypothetical protein TI39_contig322g00010 [Zymoseptoria brevis]|uniref:Uncharacterized protein n=1 Tax=Zymoseptoria brevis TaxID=1047168 RepID=A0A0F4GU65_9PEZI|nr:hypothetical protein TI39_contig322g00010 [Zymoseptoria brevis]
MAFHFDARLDSSSDDDNAAPNLAVWKAGGARETNQSGRAPVAPMGTTALRRSPERADGRKRKGGTRSPPSVVSGDELGRESDDQQLETQSMASSEAIDDSDRRRDGQNKSSTDSRKLVVEISRSEAADRDDFEDFRDGAQSVRRVLRELDEGDQVMYQVLFDDFHVELIGFNELLRKDNAEEAIEAFSADPPSLDESELPRPRPRPQSHNKRAKPSKMVSTRLRRPAQQNGFVKTTDYVDGSDVDMSDSIDVEPPKTRGRKRKQETTQYVDEPEPEDEESEESEDELAQPIRSSKRNVRTSGRNMRQRRVSTGLTDDDDEDEEVDSDGIPFLQSDLPGQRRPRRSAKPNYSEDRRTKKSKTKGQSEGMRHSGRSTRHTGGMQEVEVDDIYRSESDNTPAPAKPKTIGVREVFKPRPRGDEFHLRHNQYCDTCSNGSNVGPLIDCQGCSLVYHKSCLGHRTGRDHLVTKIGEDDFVLQCRRCVAVARKRDPMAPDQGKCQECHRHGAACRPFRPRKTPAQEQKDRDDNDGVDPIYTVAEERINNVDNVLFRCTNCFRGFHFEHLPSRADFPSMDIDQEIDVEQRVREYSRDWQCKECVDMPAKVSGIIAWKPVDEDAYDPAHGFEGVEEENKVYLVRWEGMSYFRARWMPGPWVWGVSAHSMRKAFAKREDAQHPKMRTEDAIPEDYLRTDIVLNIKFTSIVDIRTEEIDKARIREVDKALIKYKGLTYEDAVWEAPPSPDDGERWTDFVIAYNDWVAGRYVRQPKAAALKSRLEKVRKDNFQNLEKQSQPENVQGGTLMEYQMQGLNWLYYKWFTQSNAVLADEMGLGKTIQIIGFLATLIQDHSCFPFLVVVPNSTCPNWRREIKRWAPSLRVVAYYGSRESRDSAYRYELYPENSKDLRCHIVVTSYDAAADENCRKFFRGVAWQGLIVDEGQRLKNDKNQLYSALSALKTPFKILLTGTPLQNNQRELFNLLHFLDDTKNAAELEEEFQDLDQDNITRLHDLIRPYFLRRTKAQVLTFLPPMAQIIVPVSMSLVQKKLYKSIYSKNPELMKAIFSAESNSKSTERGSLSNIIMQLRKCLCHPFVYSRSIEDKNVDIASSHRNLVDASSKLKFLELLLPKLQQRGHRVLIFSQFLDMLDMVEDFLDGMQLRYQRLDGQVSSLIKQKRIDEFNAPDSPLFAFLLSTRAGGVGINLATADTVIILDPDFNPHQDIQALSRAHRIGQTKKVLCFQLVTRLSAEERIMQIGRKKLALDHVLIQEMDADDAEQTDLVSVLRHGANAVFDDQDDQEITFSDADIEHLLDRSHIEKTPSGADKTAENQFSFARVWANERGMLEESALEVEETAPDPGVWDNILKERERIAAEDAAAKAEDYGRGRRARANVDYAGEDKAGGAVDATGFTPVKRRKKRREGDESDTDFQADESEDDDVDGENGEMLANGDMDILNGNKPASSRKKSGKTPQKLLLSTPTAKSKATPKSSIKKARNPTTPKASTATRKVAGAASKTSITPKLLKQRAAMSNFSNDPLPVGATLKWSFAKLDSSIPAETKSFNNSSPGNTPREVIVLSDDDDDEEDVHPSSLSSSAPLLQTPTPQNTNLSSPVPTTPALTTHSSTS